MNLQFINLWEWSLIKFLLISEKTTIEDKLLKKFAKKKLIQNGTGEWTEYFK